MPAVRLTPAQKYLRTRCGLPAIPPAATMLIDDLDDPAARLLTTAESAEVARVTEQDIRNWARPARGLLTPADHDTDGRPLYRELDVLRAEQQTRRAAREVRLADEAARSALTFPGIPTAV
jgi:hypothetical protein